ncbi:MAG TPA: alpha/beta family hydrolase [Verrucomicrobiae bacterium]
MIQHPNPVEDVVYRSVKIEAGSVRLSGQWDMPERSRSVVLFAHGSGSSRHSPRNQAVARTLQEAGAGTLLFDLLTQEEEVEDELSGHIRFNIPFLTERLIMATRWLRGQPEAKGLRIGYFGSSTGGAAALAAAAEEGEIVQAVVSRGGRPDLAGRALSHVLAPALLIVGEHDEAVLHLNKQAAAQLKCEHKLAIVPGATHLFEEAGALEEVARLASGWFQHHLEGVS